MIAKSLLALTALLVRHCIAGGPASFCLLVPLDPSLQKDNEDVFIKRAKVISQLTKECCNADIWDPNRMHYSDSFFYNGTQVDGLGVCKGYDLYETPEAAKKFEDTCKKAVTDAKFFGRCCNFGSGGCLDKKGTYTEDPTDVEDTKGGYRYLIIPGPTEAPPSGDPKTCKVETEAGCYGVCFDENGYASVSANEATKNVCRNTAGAVGDGHYANGFGPEGCGGGSSAACIYPDEKKGSNTKCTTSFAKKFEAGCKKFAGKDFVGRMYTPDGYKAYFSNGTVLDFRSKVRK